MKMRLSVAALLLASVPAVRATTLIPVSLVEMVDEADMVFSGSVSEVSYRLSEADSADHVALPHTYVTFTIERLLKGRSERGDTITLRFQGGPNFRGKVLTIPGVPLFDRGDRDLLFVRGNRTSLCPLVGWAQGRLRLIDGLAYSDLGQPVGLAADGDLTFGPARRLRDVEVNDIAGLVLAAESDVDLDRASTTDLRQVDAETLLDHVARLVATRRPASATAARPVASADLAEPLYVQAPRALPAPALPVSAPSMIEGEPDPTEEARESARETSATRGGAGSSSRRRR